MDKFVKLTGVAAPLPMRNVDTDMIIPKQFLKTIKRTGLGKIAVLRDALRRRRQGDRRLRAQQAGLSQARRSWSRARTSAAAPVARACAVGAARLRHPLRHRPDFADIFYNNCFQNGILPIRLPQEQTSTS